MFRHSYQRCKPNPPELGGSSESSGTAPRGHALISRRVALAGVGALLFAPGIGPSREAQPREIAGIKLPRSVIARRAMAFAEARCPPFLFNHCMRTYLFGAVAMEHHKNRYDADTAFIAASLHDLGLLPAFESVNKSFEIDGADRAVEFARSNGLNPPSAETVWQAIALHDGRFVIAEHHGGEAMLVALGASSDVLGPDTDMIDTERCAEIVEAYPRLHFKELFTALAVDHCRRKPLSQRGTWLEGLCREESPSAWTGDRKSVV